ncbi:hypothetical protein [Bacterioplanoides sp.]|uniref:hypothetical protein n=1 Tax=Bacterioplanoides sp. TaxID=2066072 RepID=UPI003AFF7C29
MNEFEVFLIGGDEDETAVVSKESIDGKCKITFFYRDKSLFALDFDYFAALCCALLHQRTIRSRQPDSILLWSQS